MDDFGGYGSISHDGMSWDILGGSTANNVSLQQYPDNTSSWQTFGLERDQ